MKLPQIAPVILAGLAACTFSSCVYPEPVPVRTRVVEGNRPVYYDNERRGPDAVVVHDRRPEYYNDGYNRRDPNVVVVNEQPRYRPQPTNVVVVNDRDHRNNPPREVHPTVVVKQPVIHPQPPRNHPNQVVVVDDKNKKKKNQKKQADDDQNNNH